MNEENKWEEHSSGRGKRKEQNKWSWFKMTGAGIVGSALTLIVIPQTDFYQEMVASGHVSVNNQVEENEQLEGSNELPVQNMSNQVADYTDMIENASQSIVGVVNKQKSQGIPGFFQSQPSEQEAVEAGTGSGVIFKEEDGKAYIITNNHVIEGADEIEISLSDGETVSATLVGGDALTDLAVLVMDASESEQIIEFGNSDELRPGEQVFAIGNPLGLELSRTVTQGIISAVNRSIPVQTSAGEWNLDVIQTDAAINPGNSGGALINTKGEVIGINSLKIAQNGIEGIGFAIPSNDLIPLVEEMIDKGEITRPYLGVGLAHLSEIPSGYLGALPEDIKGGAVITTVEPGSVADEAGIRAGDVVVSMSGIEVKDASDIRKILYREVEVGDTVTMELYRDGEKKEIEVPIRVHTSL
ncbi:S1C family serine protease [Alkalihalobacillus pseudalcaliphilus]|uniref:S1C family serine protease n=1 Tax=Alkalihalobacillus pseudalcaliphilus TaxID=79884 RepID=UPI00064D8738|nr:trypsin-like peptidase domain-containing protein [Alkalihalobacillus pseudalcaliphilus]KMK76500.1 peptidase S1 [Alkalihalobacillus pseudalcaliphilus]